MADDQDFEMWDDEFLQKAIQLTEAAVCSSSSNPTQQPPQHNFRPPPQQTFPPPQPYFRPPPPPQPLYVPSISYSPPRELSQRVKEDNHKISMNHGFDCSNGINRSFLNEDDNCSKQKEIDRLKEELGRMSKQLTNMEQECVELRKVRVNGENNLRLGHSVNGSRYDEALCTKKINLKLKDTMEDHSVVRLETKGTIPCKTVGVQTDDERAISTDEQTLSANLTIEKSLSVSRKLASIWEPQCDHQSKTNLVTRLFVACETDLQVLFGSLGWNIPSKKTTHKMEVASNNSIQAFEAAKISHLYLTLTKISYDIGRLDDFLEALIDLCCLQNTMIAHRSLCVLNVVLKHMMSMDKRLCCRDNVIFNDPSNLNKGFGKHSGMGESISETCNSHHLVWTSSIIAKKIWNKDTLQDGSSPLISNSKWLFLYQTMHHILTRDSEDIMRVEAVSIMNIIVLRTDAYGERKMYGEVTVFQTISQLLGKESGIGVRKQIVHLLYLLLNCPNLMSMFCSSCKEEGTSAEVSTMNAETTLPFQCSGTILDGLTDCLVCNGNGAPATLVLKLQRHVVVLLGLLASSGRHGFELLLGRNLSQRTNYLHLILHVLASELDVGSSDSVQPSDDFRERTLLIREVLSLLNKLASSSQYSTSVLRILTNRDMACLTVDIATRLSQKSKWFLQPDTVTRQMRESEIMDLAQNFKKRVFNFLGDATSSER
ncbi:protein SENSITIVE TO UV 2 [Rutidosis leptorrhynchoides]|uniref:protein SENSITIVE TO UV 2 n=1 Tax=Rutidosis leptorrhynchoides TaxID=125765 RepID=UPI003A99009F